MIFLTNPKEKKLDFIFDHFVPAPVTSSRRHSSIPTASNSSQHPSSNGDTSSNPPRVSAIRELIDTEQRYVEDLLVVSNQFIKPLNNARVLNDYEIEQLFINWYNLIALNSNLLKALHGQVDYKAETHPAENQVVMRTPRSVSMSNIALAAQVCTDVFEMSSINSFTHSYLAKV